LASFITHGIEQLRKTYDLVKTEETSSNQR